MNASPPASSAGTRFRVDQLPPAVARLVEPSSCRNSYGEDGQFSGVIEDWSPRRLATDERRQVEHALEAVERVLAPAERGSLLTRVLALVSHYRAQANPEAVERLIAEDWAEDLAAFPMWAIDEAARWWRRNRRFRPTISEIYRLCIMATEGSELIRQRLSALLAANIDEIEPRHRASCIAAGALRRAPGSHARPGGQW